MVQLVEKRVLILTLAAIAFFVAYLAWSNPFSALAEVDRFHFPIYALAVLVDMLSLLLFVASWYLILWTLRVRTTSPSVL